MHSKKILIVEDLWWPFGSHINHILWSKVYAEKNNYKYFYKKNSRIYNLFKNNDIECYFKSLSDNFKINDEKIMYSPDINHDIEYYPTKFRNVYDYRGYLVQEIVRPSDYIKNKINNNPFLKKIRELNGKYIGMHIRWSDKIFGPYKETGLILPSKYIEYAVNIRNKYNINTIVLCCDTEEAIKCINDINSKLSNKFNIIYDSFELRRNNNWQDSFVQSVQQFNANLSHESFSEEYLTAFKIYYILFESFSIIGNYDSNMCWMAVLARRYPRSIHPDMSVSNMPAKWENHP